MAHPKMPQPQSLTRRKNSTCQRMRPALRLGQCPFKPHRGQLLWLSQGIVSTFYQLDFVKVFLKRGAERMVDIKLLRRHIHFSCGSCFFEQYVLIMNPL